MYHEERNLYSAECPHYLAKSALLDNVRAIWTPDNEEEKNLMRNAGPRNIRLRLDDRKYKDIQMCVRGYIRNNWTDPMHLVETRIESQIVHSALNRLTHYYRTVLINCALKGIVHWLEDAIEKKELQRQKFGTYIDPELEDEIGQMRAKANLLNTIIRINPFHPVQ